MKVLHFETGPLFVNTYLCFDEESKEGFIVDPGGPSKEIVDEINNNNITLNYIILTHGHGDHIGGVDYLKNLFPNSKIVASNKELEMLSDGKLNYTHAYFGRNIEPKPEILVEDNEKIKLGNLELTFISTPGHTKGGMCIYVSNCLFTGDTLFRHSIGRTDFYGGDFNEIIRSIKNKLFKYPDDTICYPGHDSFTTIGDEKRGNPFV